MTPEGIAIDYVAAWLQEYLELEEGESYEGLAISLCQYLTSRLFEIRRVEP